MAVLGKPVLLSLESLVWNCEQSYYSVLLLTLG